MTASPSTPRKGRAMSFEGIIEMWLIEYQPGLKAELEQAGRLPAWLASQSHSMQKAKTEAIAQLRAATPGLSALQAEMEAERLIIEEYLPL